MHRLTPLTGYVSAGTHWLLSGLGRVRIFLSVWQEREPMLCACFIRTPHATPIPAREGVRVERPCGRRNTIVRCLPGRPGDAIYTSRGGFSHGSRASNIRSVTGQPMGREEEGRRRIWWGEWMCVLILSQRIERNKPRRDPRQRGGMGRTSSAISKTIEFPAISKATSRPFIHPSIHPIQVPAPTTNTSPRDHVQNSSVRPDRPSRPLCHLPFLYQDHPHPRSRIPVIPTPGAQRTSGEVWGKGRSRMNIQKSMRCRWARGP